MAEVWTPPAFDDIATEETVTAAYLNQLGNSLRFLEEIDYAEFTSNVTVNATTEGAANTVVSSSAHTYEAVPHLIEFFSPRVLNGASTNSIVIISLFDSSTIVGWIAEVQFTGANQISVPVYTQTRITPTAASHTYNVKAHRTVSDGTIHAGGGGTGALMPGYIRITRSPV